MFEVSSGDAYSIGSRTGEKRTLVCQDWVRDPLYQLKTHKYMGCDGMHP